VKTLAASVVGLLVGVMLALLLARTLESLLHGVHAGDPTSVAIAAWLLLGIAGLAAWIPAHRAMRHARVTRTGTKYLGLFSDERRPDHHAETVATLQALNLNVGRAWAIKEALRTLWTYRQGAAVTRFFSQWYGWASRLRLEPVKKVAGMLKRHLGGVLRFVKHPITNGVAEGLNSKIMNIKQKAGGFRNAQNFTT